MNLHNPAFVLGLLSVWLCLLDFSMSFPSLVMPRLHRSVEAEVETNNKNMGFPQTDDDVLQLEQLRELHPNEAAAAANFNNQKRDELMADEPSPIAGDENLPELEQQLESAKPDVQSTQGPSQAGVENVGETPEIPSSEPKGMGGHRPPILQNNDGGKVENGNNNNGDKPKAKCRLGGMHGAARLVYGQNPEVLPTTTTASTTTSTTTTTTTTTPAPEANSAGSSEDNEDNDDDDDGSDDGGNEDEKSNDNVDETVDNGEAPTQPIDEPSENQQPSEGAETPQEVVPEAPEQQEVPAESAVTPAPGPPQLHPMRPIKSNKKTNKEEEPERQLIGDVIIDESALRKSTSRRSVAHMTPKTAESLLRHGNGQYSSFDMAQYVFWTGDEAGVARAVEELIQQDLMSREEALKFLHEIRVGIEYLQKSYANRIFPEEIRHNTIKKSYLPQTMPTTTTTTTSTTTTTVKPTLPYLNLEQSVDENDNINLAKTLDSISLWHKLQAMNNVEGRQDMTEYESETRRPKITDCQHKEYNLEEIIYKLARIMFTESLAHGDEAQREIQKLMDFFEREHELGIIPLDLEQKVIHVLLQALSDTLTEKPELWPAAQYPYNRLLRSYAHMNYVRPSPANV